MACRGVLFAIDDETTRALLACASDDEVISVIERVEDAWDQERLTETDKSWDAMHRALSDGTLDTDGGEYPLNRAILGGRSLYGGDDYIVSFVPASEVPDVARALATIDEAAFRERYARLVPDDYAPEYGPLDLTYTWDNFRDVAKLYARAASEHLAVVFTVDQ